ncbi:MAG TPA: SGNH/GDSL hydrolase family protein [Solirubrobacterales bacterium]
MSVQTYSSLGLQPSTSYHYRLTAWNSEDEVTGGSGSFTTKAACTKPTVTTNVAGSITDTSALLSGSVNPNGCQTTSKIEWGPSSNPTAYPNVVNGPSGATNFNVSHTASGLQPNTGYHYRISATNQTGTTPGPDKVFTTPKTKYVALGDSYSAGVGTESYIDTNCYQSTYAYPELMRSAHPGWTVVNKTCDSYWTSNVISSASAYVTPDTKWVTYTVGGNDVEFGWTIAKCALAESICWPQLDKAQQKIVSELPGKLDAVNNMIKSKAPNAKVIVLGYPKIFNGVSCTNLYSVNEQSNLNVTAEMLRNVMSTATKRAGPNFTFVDVIPVFAGHAVCDGGSGSATEWINGPSFSPAWSIDPEKLLKDSFHPKKAGQAAYYSLVNWYTG